MRSPRGPSALKASRSSHEFLAGCAILYDAMGRAPAPLLVVVAILLPACNTAFRDALKRADLAQRHGDYFGEALALRDACQAAPDEKEICRVAQQAADDVVAKHLESVKKRCAVEAVECLAALEVLSPFAGPTDQRLQPYYNRAGDMIDQQCRSAPLQAAEDAVFHVRCTEAYAQRIATPAYAEHVGLARQRAGALVDRLASDYLSQPGVAWLHETLAACLGGTAAWGQKAQAYRTSFDDAHGIAVAFTGQLFSSANQLCAELQQQAGSLVRCDGRGAPLPIDVTTWFDPMTDAPVDTLRSVDVFDHTERWENPDYRYAQAEVRRARHHLQESAVRARLAKADCDSAQSDLSRAHSCNNCPQRRAEESACNRHRAEADLEDKARRQLRECERHLSSTPAVLTRDVYRTVSYRNIEHRFQVPWHVRITINRTPYEAAGAMGFESTEREGVPAANISSLPYSPPGQQQVQAGLAEAANTQLTAAFATELDRMAESRRATCAGEEQWSDCQIEAALLSRQNPVQQFVEDVGKRLEAKLGQQWPKAACAP